jgi:hypothetical protein
MLEVYIKCSGYSLRPKTCSINDNLSLETSGYSGFIGWEPGHLCRGVRRGRHCRSGTSRRAALACSEEVCPSAAGTEGSVETVTCFRKVSLGPNWEGQPEGTGKVNLKV